MSNLTPIRRALLRKSGSYLAQVPRAALRYQSSADAYLADPPLIANSFPKSGTHLLIEILRTVPHTRYYGSFIASTPPLTLRERSTQQYANKIARVVPGEIVGAHLFHSAQTAHELGARNCIHFFLYRDLRDVAVSEAHYLTRMSPWHKMHSHFAHTLKTDDERISAVLEGVSDKGIDYPDIATRFSRFRPWLSDPNTHGVRFEDLVNDRTASVSRLFEFLRQRRPGGPVSASDTAMTAAYDPSRSHTFRQGKSGAWRRVFKPKHRRTMKEIAGRLLVDLGYESDLDW